MAKKVVDITEKLNFDENPSLKIKDIEIEVNADATTMLKIMGVLGDGSNVNVSSVNSMYELIFNENEREKIEEMKLKFDDFQTLVMSATTLVTGENSEGE